MTQSVTLRKANAIQLSINEALKGLEFPEIVSINEFQTPKDVMAQASEKFAKNMGRRTALTTALYEIRKSVGAANFQAGVDNRLAELSLLDKDFQFYSRLASCKVAESSAIINGKLEKIRNRKDEGAYYGRESEVQTSIFTQEFLADAKLTLAQLKKQKQQIQDELLELNVRTEIALSEQAVKTLSEENIL